MAKLGCVHAHSNWAITLGNTGKLLPGLGMGNCTSGQYVSILSLVCMHVLPYLHGNYMMCMATSFLNCMLRMVGILWVYTIMNHNMPFVYSLKNHSVLCHCRYFPDSLNVNGTYSLRQFITAGM